VVEIWMGSLFPPLEEATATAFPAAEIKPWKQRLRVVLDGQVVLDAEQETYDSPPDDVVIGKNTIGASSCGYAFTGEIKDVQRLPPAATPPP